MLALLLLGCPSATTVPTAHCETIFVRAFPGGLENSAFGLDGTCYDEDPDACDGICLGTLEGFRANAASLVDDGTLQHVPADCL